MKDKRVIEAPTILVVPLTVHRRFQCLHAQGGAGHQRFNRLRERIGIAIGALFKDSEPHDRRKQIHLVGKDLLKQHGKRDFYTVQEVKNANRRQGTRATSRAGPMPSSARMKTLMPTTSASARAATTSP